MTLLEENLKSNTNPFHSDQPTQYPFPLNSDSILTSLEIDPQIPNPNPNFNSFSLLTPLTNFQISQLDTQLIELNTQFFNQLKSKLNSSLTLTQFDEILTPFLENLGVLKFGGLGELEMGNNDVGKGYNCNLMRKFGSFVGKDVIGLVVDGCVLVGNWELLECLIVCNLVDHVHFSGLLRNLVAKKRSKLVSLCVRSCKDMSAFDLGEVLKLFLSPTKEGLVGMKEVRKEWESEAGFAVDMVSDVKVSEMAKEAAVLLMMAYDGFSLWELCLHFVVSASVVDEVVFSSAISRLNAEEMLRLIKYLGKWLKKYERFPQARDCPKAAATLGLNMCQWVPKLEDVVKCFGLVVDEHFSTLALRTEFHEELIAIEGVVSSLVSEGRLCCSVANAIEVLKPDVAGA